MNIEEYLATTTPACSSALDEWRWLVGDDVELWKVTKAGSAFLRDSSNGSIHFLNTIEGAVERVADDEPGFISAAARSENFEEWFWPELVDSQALLGMVPDEAECLSFATPPVLGGDVDPDNIEVCHILVHFSFAGKIHEQARNLPEGAEVQFVFEDEPEAKKPWWKFW